MPCAYETKIQWNLGHFILYHSLCLYPAKVKVKLTHHSITDALAVTSEKALVFVMDPPKDDAPDGKKSKKKKKGGKSEGPTAKNFGAKLSIDKLKSSSRFIIGWRMRLLGCQRKHVFTGLVDVGVV